WERGLHPWDVAAGLCLVKEAGGLVDTISPGGNIIENGDILVSNEVNFDTFAKLVRG
ncbi:MAG: inositol monophosphatase, partial [Alphaproteobacteria bacterium]|nr:inositol monophosphatase [Alphaproteobacteria bacterium]